MPRHDPINDPPRTREQLPYMGGTTIGCCDTCNEAKKVARDALGMPHD